MKPFDFVSKMPNMQTKPWIVQKYGGTSVGKFLDNITGSIIPEFLATYNVAIVCSARSGVSKSKGTTSLLLDAIHLATLEQSEETGFDGVIDLIKDEHIHAAREAVISGNDTTGILKELEMAIRKDCEQLRSFLKATQTLGEISERTQDRVIGVISDGVRVLESFKSQNSFSKHFQLRKIGHEVGLMQNMEMFSPQYVIDREVSRLS